MTKPTETKQLLVQPSHYVEHSREQALAWPSESIPTPSQT